MQYLRQAGAKAAGRSASRQPELVRAGADILKSLPESQATMEQAFEFASSCGRCCARWVKSGRCSSISARPRPLPNG